MEHSQGDRRRENGGICADDCGQAAHVSSAQELRGIAGQRQAGRLAGKGEAETDRTPTIAISRSMR